MKCVLGMGKVFKMFSPLVLGYGGFSSCGVPLGTPSYGGVCDGLCPLCWGGAVVVSGCWSGLFCIPGSAEVQSGDVLHLGPVECLYFPQQSDARLRTVV